MVPYTMQDTAMRPSRRVRQKVMPVRGHRSVCLSGSSHRCCYDLDTRPPLFPSCQATDINATVCSSQVVSRRLMRSVLTVHTLSLIVIMMHQTCFSQTWRRIDDRQPAQSLVSPGRMTSTVPARPSLACGMIPPRAVFPQRVEDDQQRPHAGGQGHRLGLATAHRRGEHARITGLKRAATIVAI